MGKKGTPERVQFEEMSDGDGEGGLTVKQERAIETLITSPTIIEAARKAGVSRRSISRWLREDENFRHEFKAARRQVLEHATARLQRLSCGAVGILEEILRDENASPASRISGIRALLDFAYRAFELEDIEERLAGVERRLKENPPAKPAVNVRWIELGHDDGADEEGAESTE